MERCTLCGGRLKDGRCLDCGLDNTKNDKKYNFTERAERTEPREQQKQSAERAPAGEKPFSRKQEEGKRKRKTISKVQEKRSAGKPKRRKKGVKFVLIILAVFVIIEVLGALWTLFEEYQSARSSVSVNTVDEPDGGYQEAEKPEAADWDEEGGQYFEMELLPGIYTALYSESAQRQYEEDMGECSYFELSEVLQLTDGGILCVEDCDGTLRIAGNAAGGQKERSPQGQTAPHFIISRSLKGIRSQQRASGRRRM